MIQLTVVKKIHAIIYHSHEFIYTLSVLYSCVRNTEHTHLAGVCLAAYSHLSHICCAIDITRAYYTSKIEPVNFLRSME